MDSGMYIFDQIKFPFVAKFLIWNQKNSIKKKNKTLFFSNWILGSEFKKKFSFGHRQKKIREFEELLISPIEE